MTKKALHKKTDTARRPANGSAKGNPGHGGKASKPRYQLVPEDEYTPEDTARHYKEDPLAYKNFDEVDRFHPGWPGYYGDN